MCKYSDDYVLTEGVISVIATVKTPRIELLSQRSCVIQFQAIFLIKKIPYPLTRTWP